MVITVTSAMSEYALVWHSTSQLLHSLVLTISSDSIAWFAAWKSVQLARDASYAFQQSQLFVNSLCCMQPCHARTVWQASGCNYGLGLHTFQQTSTHSHSSCTIAQIRVHDWTLLLWHFSTSFKPIEAASHKPNWYLLGCCISGMPVHGIKLCLQANWYDSKQPWSLICCLSTSLLYDFCRCV